MNDSLRKIVLYFLGSRILIFAVAFVHFNTFPSSNALDVFYHWDSNWYLSIMQNGYSLPDSFHKSDTAFFPLYPLLGKTWSIFLGPRWALFLAANVCFLFFALFFYRLTRKLFGQQVAEQTILCFVFFPLSFVFSLPYAESLFIFLVICTFWLLGKKRWLPAALVGFLIMLTRLQGLAIVPAFILALRQKKLLTFFKALIFPAICLLGLGCFFVYLFLRFGDFFAVFHAQQAWDHHLTTPLGFFLRHFFFLLSTPKQHYLFGLGLFDIGVFLFFPYLLFRAYRLLPSYQFGYCLAIVLLAFSRIGGDSWAYPTEATGRYLLMAFPLFIPLARLLSTPRRLLFYLGLAIPFLIVHSWNFFSGKWVF